MKDGRHLDPGPDVQIRILRQVQVQVLEVRRGTPGRAGCAALGGGWSAGCVSCPSAGPRVLHTEHPLNEGVHGAVEVPGGGDASVVQHLLQPCTGVFACGWRVPDELREEIGSQLADVLLVVVTARGVGVQTEKVVEQD